MVNSSSRSSTSGVEPGTKGKSTSEVISSPGGSSQAPSSPLGSPPQSGSEAGGFWTAVAQEVSKENKEVELKGNGITLKKTGGSEALETSVEGEAPQTRISDKDFWKRVGTEPDKCRQSQKTSKRQRSRCLKASRLEIERRWMETQFKKISAKKE